MTDKIKLKELSLNVLDIVQNSIKANASLVHIFVNISTFDNLLTIIVKDNGSGFDVNAYESSLNLGRRNHNKHAAAVFPFLKKVRKNPEVHLK